jgi:hypothetical protein
MADWAGIAETTIRDYFREVENDILRNRKLLAMLQSAGRIKFNQSGTAMDWKIRYKRGVPKGYSDTDTVTFPRRNRHKTATLDYRALTLDESMSRFDVLKNRGTPAIVKLLSEKATFISEDFDEFFGDQLYIDGNATGNTKFLHGIESFLGNTTASSNQPVARPSDSYAGLNTDLGNYSGSWDQNSGSDTWPVGKGTADYDFYAPLLVDYTNTNTPSATISGWSATTKTWDNTCIEALRYGVINSMKNASKRGRIDFILLNSELYRQFADRYAGKERVVIQKGGGQTLLDLGFGDVINFEGCEVTYEFGVPSATGYGFNVQQMELRSMQDKLINSYGPIENEEDKSLRFGADFFGNMIFRPRYFTKWKNYT